MMIILAKNDKNSEKIVKKTLQSFENPAFIVLQYLENSHSLLITTSY